MPDIVDTLAQRGNAYGDFREQGRITQNLKRAMQDSPNWHRIPAYMREGLDMIQHKVSRMLNGDALYDDNMHDIVGYTVLMQDRAAQDRDAGIVFQTGGDPLYPKYEHEAGPIIGTVETLDLTGLSFEEQLDHALGILAQLGFRGNDDGGITNEKGETPVDVANQHNLTRYKAAVGVLIGEDQGGFAKALPEEEEETRVVQSDGSQVGGPAFMQDPIRPNLEQKDNHDAAPASWDEHAGKVAWAYTTDPDVATRKDNDAKAFEAELKSLVMQGLVTLASARVEEEVGQYALGAFEIPKR